MSDLSIPMPKLVAKGRELVTPLNLHFAGVALLVLVNVYLAAHIVFAWRTTKVNDAAALQQQMVQRKTAEIAAQPLRGLDEKLTGATEAADKFSKMRLPYAQSQVLTELGTLTKQQGVRLTRVQYTPTVVLVGTAQELTEVRMDAALSGDYRPLVQVVNALERDKVFFLIESMGLSGQQSGTVNLRLRLTTYLRPAAAGEMEKKAPAVGDVESKTVPAAHAAIAPRPKSIPGMQVVKQAAAPRKGGAR